MDWNQKITQTKIIKIIWTPPIIYINDKDTHLSSIRFLKR